MPKVTMVWQKVPELEDISSELFFQELDLKPDKGALEACVVNIPEEEASWELKARLAGLPVQWVDLVSEIGGGSQNHRQNRAKVSLAKAKARAQMGTIPPIYTKKPALNLLIAGAGQAALEATLQACELGHPVIWATPYKDIAQKGPEEDQKLIQSLIQKLPENLEILFETEVSELIGSGGEFRAQLKGPKGNQEVVTGGVVLCPLGQWQPSDLDLKKDLITPIDEIENTDLKGEPENWKQAAILVGINCAATPYSFAKALEAAVKLQKKPYVQTTLFFTEATVALNGLERLYRKAREQGVIMARIQPRELEILEQGAVLKWNDPLLDEELELCPDLIGISSGYTAQSPEFFKNPVTWPNWEFISKDHPRYSGGKTPRIGLYITGALRGTDPGKDRTQEASAALSDCHDRLTGKAQAIPVVRHTYCASCLTCVRVCPHGVPRFVEEQIECAPAACLACGICAAECPAEAITPAGWSTKELTTGLKGAIDAQKGAAFVLFACGQSAWPAFAKLSQQGHKWPKGLIVLPVNCAGRVGQQLILKTLELGAKGVLTAGCQDGNCRSITGNLRAKLRTEEVQELMKELGLNADCVRFMHMASNQGPNLAEACRQLAELVEEN